MQFKQVYTFINVLQSHRSELDAADRKRLERFQEQFSSFRQGNELQQIDKNKFDWIIDMFAERWKRIHDTIFDYTFNPLGCNKPWVDFAKAIAQDYLLILMPTLKAVPASLVRSKEVQNLHAIYIDDNSLWRQVDDLLDAHRQNKTFSIFDGHTRSRALSIKEFYRLRAKYGEGLERFEDDEKYEHFWQLFQKKVLPTWSKNAIYPKECLPLLMGIAKEYDHFIKNGKSEALKASLDNLIKALRDYPLSCVNHFYSIPVSVGEETYFVLDILIDCYEERTTIKHKMDGLVRWLVNAAPFLLSDPSLQGLLGSPIYPEKNSLKEMIITGLLSLPITTDNQITLRHQILQLIKKDLSINLINHIKTLYALHWQEIKDTTEDYLRATREKESLHPWIHLAQQLAGVGMIEANYYKLLIQSLIHDEDIILNERLAYLPLSYFILSNDETELIYLPNSINYYREYGLFYNCNGNKPRAFQDKELERLNYAGKKFRNFFAQLKGGIKDKPLSFITIQALRKLVCLTLNTKALLYGYDITFHQQWTAEQAYFEFFDYLENCLPDEKERILKHSIILDGKKKSVQQLINTVQNKEDASRECIAIAARYFLQLVLDYDYITPFPEQLEKSPMVEFDTLRENSKKLIYREYENENAEEAIQKLRYLFIHLFLNDFPTQPLEKEIIHYNGCVNHVTKIEKIVFDRIRLTVINNNLQEACFVYANCQVFIREKIKAIQNQPLDRMKVWLKAINDGSFFAIEKEMFDPKNIVMSLFHFRSKDMKVIIDSFLIAILEKKIDENSIHYFLRANIGFFQLLKCEIKNYPLQEKILVTLRQQPEIPNDALFVKQCNLFLKEIESSEIKKDAKVHRFFSRSTNVNDATLHARGTKSARIL